MINVSEIKTGLIGVNGWKQSLITGAPVIDAANLATSSGAYYNQDFSGLVTVDNIVNVYEKTDLSAAQVNTLLSDIVKGAASTVLNAVFGEDDFIENNLLYSNEFDLSTKLDNDTSFVGYEIEIAQSKDILNIINRIALTFDGIQSVKVLLFHSSKNAPITSTTITTVANTETNKDVLDFLLPYTNSVNGGKWYIGYLRSELTSKAYNRNFENANLKNHFLTCNFQPIKVTGHNTETLFDVRNVENTSETWGMNFDISAFKSYDSIILRNKNKFSKALGLQVATIVLDMIINSTSSNRIERATRDNAIIQLEGYQNDNIQTLGVLKKLGIEIANLKKSFVNKPIIQINTIQ